MGQCKLKEAESIRASTSSLFRVGVAEIITATNARQTLVTSLDAAFPRSRVNQL